MSNPARELHGIYTSWQAKLAEKASRTPRQIIAPAGRGFDEAIRAAGLLVRMHQLIGQLDEDGYSVDLYRRQLPGWLAPLASANVASGAGWSLDAALLDQIEGFANFLDGKVPVVGADKMANLLDVVARAIELLAQDGSLPEYLKTYIRRLLQQIRTALEDAQAGTPVDIGGLAYSLWVAFAAAEGQSKSKGSVWKDLGHQLLTGTISGAIVQGTTFAIATLAN